MKITWEENELGELLRQAHPTRFSTGRIADHVVAIYEANIAEDIADAIHDLEENPQ